MVRVFQFKNTVFNDRVHTVHGEYCVIGYFDALDMHVEKNSNPKACIEWLNIPDREYILDREELGDLYTVNGLRPEALDKKRDEMFWEDTEGPLIFISCVRFKRPDPYLLNKIRKIEENEQTIVYTTLDSSDVLICHRNNSYALGHEFLMRAQTDICRDDNGDSNNMLICFSVIAIRQEFLDEIEKEPETQRIGEETITCLHKCIVRDKDQSHAFYAELSENKKLLEENPGILFSCSETIGTDDMIIHIENISLRSWLSLFALNHAFTHGYYGCAFFNVQSSILPKTLQTANYPLKKTECASPAAVTELKSLLEKCRERHEFALMQCCERMIRLNWAFQKINNNDLVAYLSKMLLHVFPISEEYFAERVGACLASTTKKDRSEYEKILSDIQKSVTHIWEAEDSILHSTNAADRIVIQAAPVDTGLRYVSPKLCYYYSEMLRELSHLLRKDDVEGKYGFLVSPSVSNETIAEVLFSTNPEHGKVCLISVPENMIADVQRVRMLLLHEFFHIIPVGLRKRKLRALYFLKVLLYDVETNLFSGLAFENQQEEENIRKLFMDRMVKNLQDKLRTLNEDDRIFYGSQLMGLYVDAFKEATKRWLTIDLSEIINTLAGNNKLPYDKYCLKHERALGVTEKIHANALMLLLTNRVERICELYMDLFREPFCDIFTILTECSDPERYMELFKTGHSGDCGWELRLPLLYRIYFVIDTMTAPLPDELSMIEQGDQKVISAYKGLIVSWQQWQSNLMDYAEENSLEESVGKLIRRIENLKGEPWSYQIKETINHSEQQLSESGSDLSFMMNVSSVDEYHHYFLDCRNAYIRLQILNQKGFESYRRRFELDGEVDNMNTIEKISLRLWEMEGGE